LAHAVISVRNTARFADALSILFDNRVSGVAVLSQSKLVGNISASDLRVRWRARPHLSPMGVSLM
jgi:CBS domain-containing protein